MNITYDRENKMFICTNCNDAVKIIGTKWDSSKNCEEPFINIALFYESVAHYFDINIFTDKEFTADDFTNFCQNFFEEKNGYLFREDFFNIYDIMQSLTKAAFSSFNPNSISVFSRRKRLLEKAIIICYSTSDNETKIMNFTTKTTIPPLDYPGTRDDEI